MHHLLHTTLVQTVFSVTGSLIGALILLAVVHKVQKNQANLIMMILSSIMIFSGAVVALVIRQLFGLTGLPGIIIANMVLNVPLAFFIVYERWLLIDPVLVLLARDAGASGMQVVRDVYWPWLKPALLQASLLITFFCAMGFSIPLVMGGDWQTVTVYLHRAYGQKQCLVTKSYTLWCWPALIINSVVVAGISSTLAVLLATMSTYITCFSRYYTVRFFLNVIIGFLLLVDSSLISLALVKVGICAFSAKGAAILVLAIVQYPIAYRLVKPYMSAYCPQYTHTAQALGATYWQAVRTVLLPFISSGNARVWIILFGYGLNDIGPFSALPGDAFQTLAVVLRDAIAHEAHAHALVCGLIMLASTVIVHIVWWLMPRTYGN